MMKKTLLILALLLNAMWLLHAVDTLIGTPDKAGFIYRCGDLAQVTLQVVPENGRTLKDCKLRVTLDGQNADALSTVREYDLNQGLTHEFSGTLKQPGFLTMNVMLFEPGKRGQQLVRRFSLAFEPEKIQPGLPAPDDFLPFWQQEIRDFSAKAAPIEQKKLDQYSIAGKYTTYLLTIPTPDGHIYGFLCVPDRSGAQPALVSVCHAGPGFLKPELSDRFVTLALNIHPYSPSEAPQKYTAQNQGKSVNQRFSAQYMYQGLPDARRYYFYNAVIGTVGAVEWLAKQPFVNAEKIGYYGQSQGGGFGLILAALTGKFKHTLVLMPAFCDQNAAVAKRLSGWPCLDSCLPAAGDSKAIAAMARYYDAANFSAAIKTPVRVIVGFQDFVCPPDSVYAAYNQLAGPKSILNLPRQGHSAGAVYASEVGNLKQRIEK